MKPAAMVTVQTSPLLMTRLAERFELLPALDPAARAATIAEHGARIEVVVTNGTTGLSAAQIAGLPRLRIACALGAGYEGIDVAATRARGIAVTHGPGTNDSSVADHAMALMLAVMRGIPMVDAAVRRGGWNEQRAPRPSIFGKRLGIFGMGRIGAQIAQRAAGGFGMPVAYHNRKPRPDTPYRYCGSLTELAESSDVLVCVAPGGAATRHAVDVALLRALGPKGFLVNVGRGTVVDSAALAEALSAGVIAGAALDVLEGEPEIPAALLAAPNLIITPHMAGRAPEAQAAIVELVLRNIDAHFAGASLATPVP